MAHSHLGVTNDLGQRVWQHKTKALHGFSAKDGVDRLVWYEVYDRIDEAITRKKQLKKWRRAWRIALIETMNPDWTDLYDSLSA